MRWNLKHAVSLGASGAALGSVAVYARQDDHKGMGTGLEKAKTAVSRYQIVKGVPGMVVAVSKNNKLQWAEGFGFADVENMTPCTPHTKMRIASISKPIAATLAAKLMQEGKLNLDDSINEYVKDFPQKSWNGKPVTITTKQLLCHKSGIRNYKEFKQVHDKDAKISGQDIERARLPEFYSNAQYHSVADALEMFKNDPLDAEPGTKFGYTTHGYTALAAVLEGAGDRAFDDQLRDLLKQMGMHQTILDENEPVIANRSRYYFRNGKKGIENVHEVNCSYKRAGGGIVSTVLDLVRFGNIWMNSGLPNSLLTHETVDFMWNNELGWSSKTSSPEMEPKGSWSKTGYICHTGGAVGASSVLVIKRPNDTDNDSGVCVAILANLQDCGGLTALALEIIDALSSDV